MKTNYYVHGSTVRQLEGEPWERAQRAEEERRRKQHQENVRAAKINQERAKHMSLGYVLLLTVLTAVVAYASIQYIKFQTEVNTHIREISRLESSIAEVKMDNNAIERRIATFTDIDTIRYKAVNELGMGYAKESQIKTFSMNEGDYMNQFADVK